jgi:uncharacterized protein with von Willebrand factor type A (vWA) domain
MKEQGGNLLHNLLLFGRLLRRLGMDVNPGRMIDLVQALEHIEIGNRTDFYNTLRSLLVHRHDQLPLFDQAFNLFWRQHNETWLELDLAQLLADKQSSQPLVTPPPLQEAPGATTSADDHSDAEEQLVFEVTRTYSARERLRYRFQQAVARRGRSHQAFYGRTRVEIGAEAHAPFPVRAGCPA